MKKIVWIIIAVVIIGGVIYYFTKDKNLKDKEVVKVGVLLPLTGPVSEPGNNVLKGINIVIEKYNLQNKPKIKLFVEDSKANPKDGLLAYNKLTKIDNVKIILGDLISSVTLAIAPLADKEQIIILAPGSSNPNIKNSGEYIFRNWVSDDFDGKVMANYIYKNHTFRNIALIYLNNDYGIGLKDAFNKSFSELGGKIVYEDSYNPETIDFKSLILKIPSKTDAIYLPGNPKENAILIKQLNELNVRKPLFSNISVDNNDFINIAKGKFDSIIYTTPFFDPTSDDSQIKDFNIIFKNKFGYLPDVTAAHGFDAASILINALTKCNFDLSLLKDSLYKVQNFSGITGLTSFDNNGDVIKDLMIKVIKSDGTKYTINKSLLK